MQQVERKTDQTPVSFLVTVRLDVDDAPDRGGERERALRIVESELTLALKRAALSHDARIDAIRVRGADVERVVYDPGPGSP